MIVLPTRGVAGRQRAVTQHHISIDVFADWIEASVLLLDTDVSVTDVVDVLLAEELYEDQDFARDITQTAWQEIEKRRRHCDLLYGVFVDGEWIRVSPVGPNRIPHLFMLILSLSTNFDWWHKHFGCDYNDQGRLFESVTECALRSLSPGWSTFATGWQAAKTKQSLLTIAESVASLLNTGPIVRPNWDPRKSKDLTLDIVLYQPFLDTRQGAPYILFQCASGRNWDEKLKEPDVDLWRKLLNPDFPTIRGVSLPFCLTDDGFHFASPKTSGFLLDRCRLLLAASKCNEWIATDLKGQLVDWMTPRTKEIIKRSE